MCKRTNVLGKIFSRSLPIHRRSKHPGYHYDKVLAALRNGIFLFYANEKTDIETWEKSLSDLKQVLDGSTEKAYQKYVTDINLKTIKVPLGSIEFAIMLLLGYKVCITKTSFTRNLL